MTARKIGELTKILHTPGRYNQSTVIKGIMIIEVCLLKLTRRSFRLLMLFCRSINCIIMFYKNKKRTNEPRLAIFSDLLGVSFLEKKKNPDKVQ